MSEQESKKQSVLSIAFATGEGISPEELPVLRMEWTYSGYKLVEGRELIEAALMESMRKGEEPSLTIIRFVIAPIPKRKRRTRSSSNESDLYELLNKPESQDRRKRKRVRRQGGES